MANIIKAPQKGVLATLAESLNLSPEMLQDTLKKTAFSTCKTNEQFVTMCVVAAKYGLNPLTKEIYAFPDRNGRVVPVVGVDGWIRIMNDHPQFDGIEFEEGDGYCTAKIFRKDRSHATEVTEWLDECAGTSEPWKRWPRRMLRNKATIQAARIAFGFSGIYDPDEADRIVEAQTAESLKDAPTNSPKPSLREVLKVTSSEVKEDTPCSQELMLEADQVVEEAV